MTEELLQYLWLAGLFNANALKTKEGLEITIFKRGTLNIDSGPDFKNAHLRIGDTDWFGNIEIHYRSNEWYQHKHQLDKAYNSVILHVVFEDNGDCLRQDGTKLHVIELKDKIHHLLIERYNDLKKSVKWIACQDFISNIDEFTVELTLHRALIDRLEKKSQQIVDWLQLCEHDWATVFYTALARSYGFGTNSDAFEMLAKQLPLKFLLKHHHDAIQTEALVFGVSGFLDENIDLPYHQTLKKEWAFLKKKYDLHSLEKSNFKFLRMRPGNFPSLRLAQFASIASKSSDIFNALINNPNLDEIYPLFQTHVNTFWETHYHFNTISSKHQSKLSEVGVRHMIINTVVPFLFVYGKQIGNESLCEKALTWLEYIPAEKNRIIQDWSNLHIIPKNAFDSQALIELKQNHCDPKKCLSCPIGAKVLNL